MPPPELLGATRVLPMLLRIGDRLTDATCEYDHWPTVHDDKIMTS
jgi:hypothetical protein